VPALHGGPFSERRLGAAALRFPRVGSAPISTGAFRVHRIGAFSAYRTGASVGERSSRPFGQPRFIYKGGTDTGEEIVVNATYVER
jgi:hypothetical protein